MKILLVGNYPPPFGGISVHVQLLHRLLLQKGIDCKVLNIDPQARISQDYINIKNHADFFVRLVSASRGRIVHLHTNGHNPRSWLMVLACALIGSLIGCGSILTIHSGMAPEFIKQNGFMHRQLLKLALSPQSLVICVNEEIRSALASSGFNLENTMLMPAFLFDEADRVSLDSDLKRLLSKFDPLLSMVAFFRPEYGVELLIEALGALKRQFPRIACAVMGSGKGKEQLRQLAVRRGVADQLLWLGDRDHRECLSVMEYSHLFVRPTLADGDSISVREAVLLAVPVVASDVGNRPESALLFRSGDAADLAAKCAAALAARLPVRKQSPVEFSGNLLYLIDAYNRISNSQIATDELQSAKR